MVQVEFSREDGYKDTHRVIHKTVWICESWKLKKGDVVSFEDLPNLKWNVVKVYKTVVEIEYLHKKWGLELPKSQRTER